MICNIHKQEIIYFLINSDVKQATQSTFKCSQCLANDCLKSEDQVISVYHAVQMTDNEKQFQRDRITSSFDKINKLQHEIIIKINNQVNNLLKEITKRLIIVKHINFKLMEEWIMTNKCQIDDFFFKNNGQQKTMLELSKLIVESNDHSKIITYYNQYIQQVRKIDSIQNLQYNKENIEYFDSYIKFIYREFVDRFDKIFKFQTSVFFNNKTNLNIIKEMENISQSFIQQETNYHQNVISIIKEIQLQKQNNIDLFKPQNNKIVPQQQQLTQKQNDNLNNNLQQNITQQYNRINDASKQLLQINHNFTNINVNQLSNSNYYQQMDKFSNLILNNGLNSNNNIKDYQQLSQTRQQEILTQESLNNCQNVVEIEQEQQPQKDSQKELQQLEQIELNQCQQEQQQQQNQEIEESTNNQKVLSDKFQSREKSKDQLYIKSNLENKEVITIQSPLPQQEQQIQNDSLTFVNLLELQNQQNENEILNEEKQPKDNVQNANDDTIIQQQQLNEQNNQTQQQLNLQIEQQPELSTPIQIEQFSNTHDLQQNLLVEEYQNQLFEEQQIQQQIQEIENENENENEFNNQQINQATCQEQENSISLSNHTEQKDLEVGNNQGEMIQEEMNQQQNQISLQTETQLNCQNEESIDDIIEQELQLTIGLEYPAIAMEEEIIQDESLFEPSQTQNQQQQNQATINMNILTNDLHLEKTDLGEDLLFEPKSLQNTNQTNVQNNQSFDQQLIEDNDCEQDEMLFEGITKNFTKQSTKKQNQKQIENNNEIINKESQSKEVTIIEEVIQITDSIDKSFIEQEDSQIKLPPNIQQTEKEFKSSKKELTNFLVSKNQEEEFKNQNFINITDSSFEQEEIKIAKQILPIQEKQIIQKTEQASKFQQGEEKLIETDKKEIIPAQLSNSFAAKKIIITKKNIRNNNNLNTQKVIRPVKLNIVKVERVKNKSSENQTNSKIECEKIDNSSRSELSQEMGVYSTLWERESSICERNDFKSLLGKKYVPQEARNVIDYGKHNQNIYK